MKRIFPGTFLLALSLLSHVSLGDTGTLPWVLSSCPANGMLEIFALHNRANTDTIGLQALGLMAQNIQFGLDTGDGNGDGSGSTTMPRPPAQAQNRRIGLMEYGFRNDSCGFSWQTRDQLGGSQSFIDKIATVETGIRNPYNFSNWEVPAEFVSRSAFSYVPFLDHTKVIVVLNDDKPPATQLLKHPHSRRRGSIGTSAVRQSTEVKVMQGRTSYQIVEDESCFGLNDRLSPAYTAGALWARGIILVELDSTMNTKIFSGNTILLRSADNSAAGGEQQKVEQLANLLRETIDNACALQTIYEDPRYPFAWPDTASLLTFYIMLTLTLLLCCFYVMRPNSMRASPRNSALAPRGQPGPQRTGQPVVGQQRGQQGGQPMGGQTVGGETVGEQTVGGQTVGGQTVGELPPPATQPLGSPTGETRDAYEGPPESAVVEGATDRLPPTNGPAQGSE